VLLCGISTVGVKWLGEGVVYFKIVVERLSSRETAYNTLFEFRVNISLATKKHKRKKFG
jgi:hypothetical protein